MTRAICATVAILLVACGGGPRARITNRDVVPLLVRVGTTSNDRRDETFLLPGEHYVGKLSVQGEASMVLDVVVGTAPVRHYEIGYLEDDPITTRDLCVELTQTSVTECKR